MKTHKNQNGDSRTSLDDGTSNLFVAEKGLKWNDALIVLEGGPFPDRDLLVVSGGREPDGEWLKSMAQHRSIWAVDSGADHCRGAYLIPDRAIGDFDSVDPGTMAWILRNEIERDSYDPDKDLTDLQIALDLCERDLNPIFGIITGVWGGRFDHVWSTVNSVIKKNSSGGNFRFLGDQAEMMVIMKGGERLRVTDGLDLGVISLLALSDLCEGVYIEGVKWPLEGVTLRRDYPYSISNVAVGSPVDIWLDRGCLGVYLSKCS